MADEFSKDYGTNKKKQISQKEGGVNTSNWNQPLKTCQSFLTLANVYLYQGDSLFLKHKVKWKD